MDDCGVYKLIRLAFKAQQMAVENDCVARVVRGTHRYDFRVLPDSDLGNYGDTTLIKFDNMGNVITE